MEYDLREQLEAELIIEIQGLYKLDQGSKEHSNAVNSIVKLYNIKIDEDKLKANSLENTKKVKKEFNQEMVRTGVNILGILAPLAFYGVWMSRGFKFEETGTFTSNTFKNLFQKFKPVK